MDFRRDIHLQNDRNDHDALDDNALNDDDDDDNIHRDNDVYYSTP